ncbi:MAG: hypothetical protein Kow00117_23320 [Phototrophicales bacterium]
MSKIEPQILIDLFQTNYNIIKMKTDGITHEQSLLQPPFPANCFNWVMGHLLVSRDTVLRWLNEPCIWNEAESKRYGFGSQPITNADDPEVKPFEVILSDYRRQHDYLVETLGKRTMDDLDVPFKDKTLADYLAFMVFHDSYHTGQTEFLRELAGKSDNRI